jgi:threonine-phosphate decarboxylase
MRKIPRPYTDPSYLFRHGGVAPADRPRLLDFSASINPLGPPASVLRALRQELPSIAHYPDPECRELTNRLAALHGVAPEQIVVGNGSNELIYAIARAFRPKRVAIAEPTYTEYLRASLSVGAAVDHWLAEGRQFKFKPFDAKGADLVWLANPNNPTGGRWAGTSHMARWMSSYPCTNFVVDEAFLPLLTESFVCNRGLPPSMIWKLKQVQNLVVLRSLTKVYGLAGLRLGYTVSTPDLAGQLRAQLSPWSVNALAQRAGLAALDDQEYWRKTRQWFMADITSANGLAVRSFESGLRKASPLLRPLPSQTSFVLVHLKTVRSDWLKVQMAHRGIAIRDASNFVGLDQSYIRVARHFPADNARLFAALHEILSKEKSPCPAH